MLYTRLKTTFLDTKDLAGQLSTKKTEEKNLHRDFLTELFTPQGLMYLLLSGGGSRKSPLRTQTELPDDDGTGSR
jgi:hypothetical protein